MADYNYSGAGTITMDGEADSLVRLSFVSGGGDTTITGTVLTSTLVYTVVNSHRSEDQTLHYAVEYSNDNLQPSENCIYFHLRDEVPFYQNKVAKEVYTQDDYDPKHSFIDNLFNIGGITDVSVQAYRVWVQIAPSYTLEEVEEKVASYLQGYMGYDYSATGPGHGIQLRSQDQRRPLSNFVKANPDKPEDEGRRSKA